MSAREPWREHYLVYGAPFIGDEEREEVQACIDSGWLGSGPRVHQFEQEFASYTGAPHAVGLNSCTAALQLALKVLDIPPGSEVIVPAITFCATANAVVHAGLIPVFADVDPETCCIDMADLERRVTGKTRAIVPVHFAGRPCKIDDLLSLARKHSLFVIEDCAHAIESTYRGAHCGTFGDLGCFSFYITKNITTVEGGMVVCADEKWANRIKMQALHGMTKDAWARYSDDGYVHYEVVEPGYKFNLTDIAASFGLHQLRRVEQQYQRRAELWSFYLKELVDLPLILPAPVDPETRHAHHIFSCIVDDQRSVLTRDDVISQLHELKIGTGIHYTALHLHKYYRERFAYQEGDLPSAESIGARTFSIPLSPSVTDTDAADVVRALRLILE